MLNAATLFIVLFGYIPFNSIGVRKKNVLLTKMEYFVVFLKCKRYFALPKHWIENPVLGKPSTVFFSGNGDSTPDFTCERKYYINQNVNACYDAFVYKSFDTYEAAHHFALNKRVVAPIQYRTLATLDFSRPLHEPVDSIEISDSDISESDSDSNVRFYLTTLKQTKKSVLLGLTTFFFW